MRERSTYLARFARTAAVFDGLAGDYDRHRPDYPAPVLKAWRGHLERGRGRAGPRLVADLGCGTGISTRALARVLEPGDAVIGVEPGADMRAAFRVHPETATVPLIAATGERLPFAPATLDAIVIAQAAHWMDRPALFAEARLALAPGGTLAMLTNNRHWPGSPFLAAYEALLERLSPGYDRRYRAFDYAAELDQAGAADVLRATHTWERALDAGGFLGLVRSTSMFKNAVAAHGEAAVGDGVRALAAEHADAGGRLAVPYETELVAGRLA